MFMIFNLEILQSGEWKDINNKTIKALSSKRDNKTKFWKLYDSWHKIKIVKHMFKSSIVSW
jgi:hypothetical protein